MKKIKLKSLVDPSSDNIEDIYSNICNELNLGIKQDKKLMKQIESKQKNQNIKAPSKVPISNKKTDDDLILSMTKRLNLVEQNLKDANYKLKQKDDEILKLKQRIKELEKKQNTSKKDDDEVNEMNCENCIKMNKIIEHQNEYITKLYNFMNENGILISKSAVDPKSQEEIQKKLKSLEYELNKLNIDNGEEEPLEVDKSTSSAYDKSLLPKTIDIKVLARRIEEMNAIIYEEQGSNAEFESEDGKIFKLKQRKEILISFYKNGLIIEGYQFFPYESEQSQKIIQDIIDGYSPYILHERYPHGVLMKVENHVKIVYEPNQINISSKNIKDLKDPGEQKYMSPKEFVNIFPNKVIKNGNILNIKEDMEKVLGIKNSNKEKNSDNEAEVTDFNLYDIKNTRIKQEDLCKLKIKVVTVDKTINVNIPKNRHINELFDFVKNYVNENLKKVSITLKINNISDYGFIMTFPFKILNYEKNVNKENTLEKCGLFPSLFITFDVLSKYQQK